MTEEVTRIEARADSLVDSHDELMRELVAMRHKHNLTQEVVAERMSVSQPTVAAFERYDSNPTLATIRRYALAVGARIQNSVIDDCEEHAAPFEHLVEIYNLHAPAAHASLAPIAVKKAWGAPKLRMAQNV
ncbi:helix-turn-helix domain-containing protein [Arthrobacter sp. GCM10027362]|uniref:helix-turn-helix domain-containing protein n=1 Tax=Arthrobacter sp. GCM10027362 TaxID=3273379 RepID=UPI003636AEE3